MLEEREIKRLEAKITALETMTTAEFKIIICSHAWFGLKRKARALFNKYNLNKTKDRNAVLIMLVENDREFLIYGDEGIHNKVGDEFWQSTRQTMAGFFRQGEIANGLSTGLHLIADALTEHFPGHNADTNEISNEIIFES